MNQEGRAANEETPRPKKFIDFTYPLVRWFVGCPYTLNASLASLSMYEGEQEATSFQTAPVSLQAQGFSFGRGS